MIKLIDDIDFFDLIALNYMYLKSFNDKPRRFDCTKALVDNLLMYNATACGLYKNNILVGFILGYNTDLGYYFDSAYILPKYRYYAKALYNFAETNIKVLGYNKWYCTINTELGKKFIEHYGATNIVDNIYIKEI